MVPEDVSRYGPVFAALLRDFRLAPLGPGSPNANAESLLRRLTLPSAFRHAQVADRNMAECCLAGIWLYHDFLDESHKICQEIETPSGSYWHALMHRREPDFSNSKYWFRQVRTHAVFEPLYLAASELAAGITAAPGWLGKSSTWDPFAFVDFCEQCSSGNNNLVMLCRQIGQREWELLFDYCYSHAVSENGSQGR